MPKKITKKEKKTLGALALIFVGFSFLSTPVSEYLANFSDTFRIILGIGVFLVGAYLFDVW